MIKKQEIPVILSELMLFLKPLNSVFNLNEYKLLGSTRQMVEDVNSKDETKDIDILIPIFNLELTNEIDLLKEFLNSKQIENYFYFGNVIKFFLPRSNNESVHIDVMISENNINKIDYLSNLRFYSNEPFNENNFKGLHRTELIRSLLKSFGLVLGDTGIKHYVLKKEFQTLDNDTLFSVIKNKQNKAKKDEIKKTYEFLLTLPLESYLNQYSNKYNDYKLVNRYNVFGITDFKLNKMVVDLFYDKVDSNSNWINILKTRISNKHDYKLMFNTFESLLIYLPEICKFNIQNISFILNDYIDELQRKDNDYYTNKVLNKIKYYLPYIKIPEVYLF